VDHDAHGHGDLDRHANGLADAHADRYRHPD
jgi:hypothetical protein